MNFFQKGHEFLEKIAAAKGSNAKKAVIKSADEGEKKVLFMILNPFMRYGLRKMPDIDTVGAGLESDTAALEMLQKMADRELTGNAAADALATCWTLANEAERECIKRILLKDTKAGIGISTVNSVFKGFIPDFKVMLADKYDPDKMEFPVFVQPKLDGIRTICRVDTASGAVDWLTREGNPITVMDHLNGKALELAVSLYSVLVENGSAPTPCILYLDGEGVTGSFNKTVSEMRKKNKKAEDAQFAVFDFFTASSLAEREQLEDYTMETRYRYLKEAYAKAFDGKSSDHFGKEIRILVGAMAETHDDVMNVYRKLREAKVEGVIVKDLKEPYHFRRNRAWSKIKDQIEADGEIIGFEAGDPDKGFAHTLGSVVVRIESGVEVNVASGLSLEQRDEIWANQDKYLGRLTEIHGHEYTPDGSIRHPRFENWPNCLRDSETHVGDKV